MERFVGFRADDALVEALEAAASRDGVSVSEVIRRAILGNLEPVRTMSNLCEQIAQAVYFEPNDGDISIAQAARSGIPLCAAFDPMDAIEAAARGELGAMRKLADAAAYFACSGSEDADPHITLAEGLVLARMAASIGNSDDALRVVNMLALYASLSSGEVAHDLAGEAIARLELLADTDGPVGEEAAQVLAAAADHEHPETLKRAQEYRARLATKETAQ